MTKYLYPLFLFCFLIFLSNQLQGQEWFGDALAREADRLGGDRQIRPAAARVIQVDLEALKAKLSDAPRWHTPGARENAIALQLPMPNGHNQTFQVVEAPVMAAALSSRFPGMRSFAGYSEEDGTAYARFGFTHKGFHAMILSGLHATVYIDLYAEGQTRYHQVYYKSAYTAIPGNDFTCRLEDNHLPATVPEVAPAALLGDCSLRQYRMAIACTGEYAQFHGGTVADVLAAYNVAMTRVNGVYERDFTIHMDIIEETDQVIYLDAATDPYSNNNSSALLGENQATIDAAIGTDNYDIGHVFSTGGGGIASLASVCTNRKARGVTGLPSPVNDPFYIDYVAHEIGHQFGANHTQNNSCNRVSATAMEPGSASTIMGYAGICNPNVQNNSDDYFHAISIQEVTNTIEFGNSSTCPELIDIGNTAPVLTNEAGPVFLPVSTPFFLTADATDAEGDNLTYCWEQMDNEVATMPPVSASTEGPAFRSLLPTASPTRFFPNLNALVSNTPDAWEVLPSVSRSMNFRCSVRDNFPGGGCVNATDVELVFSDDAGPFVVQAPNTNVVWEAGAEETVLWEVAGTDQAPVNCSLVDIYLSTDGGFTYPFVLAQGVPNDGEQSVVVPLELTSTARVQVVASESIFFDISDENFAIQLPPSPTVLVVSTPSSQAICNDTSAVYEIDFTPVAGFGEPLELSVAGLPDGAVATFDESPVLPDASTVLTVSDLGGVASGVYELSIEASSPSLSKAITVELDVAGGAPAAPGLTAPPHGASLVPQDPTLSWSAPGFADQYLVELASSPAFGPSAIIADTLFGTSLDVSGLEEQTVYYWRVSALNECGTGVTSGWSSFQTLGNPCERYTDDAPDLEIPSSGTGEFSTTLVINEDFDIDDLSVGININHTWVGDLSATLSSEDGTTIALFDQPGVPASDFGCSQDNLLADFDDDANLTAGDLESSCESSGPYAISGSFQPLNSLSAFQGLPAAGTWTLTISDAFNQDGGNLASWWIEACPAGEVPAPADTLANLTLEVPYAQSQTITSAYLAYQKPDIGPESILYTITALPEHGTLELEGAGLVEMGQAFSQADINEGLLSYQHNGSMANTDEFVFDLTDTKGGWRSGEVFRFTITDPSLLAASAMASSAVSCAGAADGVIEIMASGGLPPYTYALVDGTPQDSAVFSGLSAGTYSFVVRDAAGQETALHDLTLTEPDPLVVAAGTSANELVLTANGGTPPYLYSVDGGVVFEETPVFGGLPNGGYDIVTVDANGCTATSDFLLDLLESVQVATTDNTCADEAEGAISVNNIQGGAAPYLFTLNNGTPQPSPDFTGLEAGLYDLLITDANGSVLEVEEVLIEAPAPLQLNTILTGNNLTLEGIGGTPPYQYSIDGGANLGTSAAYTGLPNGTYALLMLDANGCSATGTATINQILSADVAVTDVSCAGAADGRILVGSIEGGEAPYSFQLGAGIVQESPLFEGLLPGSYSIAIYDAHGNALQLTGFNVGAPQPLELTTEITGASLALQVEGGTPPYLYSLDGGNTFSSEFVFPALANGTYSVVVIDANDCATGMQATINVLANADASVTSVSCAGSVDGVIEVNNVQGGAPPYTYSINGGDGQESSVFENLAPGVYSVMITDANTSSITLEGLVVAEPDPVEVEVEVVEDNIFITASGGTPPYLYSIDGGEYFDTPSIYNDLPNGEYEVIVWDINGCEAELQIVTVMVSGTEEFPADWMVRFLPNPTSGPLMVAGKGFEVHELEWSLVSPLGQVLQSGLLPVIHQQWQLPLRLSPLPAGVYWIQIQTVTHRRAWPVVRQ